MKRKTKTAKAPVMPLVLIQAQKEIDKHCLRFEKLLNVQMRKMKTVVSQLKKKRQVAVKKKNTCLRKYDQMQKKIKKMPKKKLLMKSQLKKAKTALNSAKKTISKIDEHYHQSITILDQLKLESNKCKEKEKILRNLEKNYKIKRKAIIRRKDEKAKKRIKKVIPFEKSLSPTVIALSDENHDSK